MNDGIRHILEYASKQKAIGREATSAELHSIADVIDCEMRNLKNERDHWMELAHQWEAGASTRGFAERLEAAASERADVTIFGVDYMAYPLDADGVPIHAGDMLDGYGKTIEVVELRHGRSGWVIVSRDGNAYADCAAFSHHYATTVEDMLREFAKRWDDPAHYAKGELVETFAEKLQLKEG